MIDEVKIYMEKLNKNLYSEFSEIEIELKIELALELACCPCDVKIVSLLAMCLLLDDIQSRGIDVSSKYKNLVYSGMRLAKSKGVGSVSVSYADGESEYDRNYYGKLYKQLCEAKSKRSFGVMVIR